MQLTQKKKAAKSPTKYQVHKSGAAVCGACGYKRKTTDLAPKWQCPSCEVAYVKVSKSYKEKNREPIKERYIRQKRKTQEVKDKKAITTGVSSLLLGTSFLSKAAKTCGCAAASGIGLKLLGASLILGSVIYLMSKLSG